MKEKLRIAAMVLLVIALLAIMGGFWTFVSWQAGQEKQQEMAEGQSGQQEEGGLEAMYISLGASGEEYVLADASKFGTITATEMFPLEAATIITDHLPEPHYRDYTSIEEV